MSARDGRKDVVLTRLEDLARRLEAAVEQLEAKTASREEKQR